MAVALVQHDIPLGFSDHLSPLFKQCFPDSKIASKYSSARTKTIAIINKCVTPYLMTEMARNLSKQPFSLAIEGCNRIGEGGTVYDDILMFAFTPKQSYLV